MGLERGQRHNLYANSHHDIFLIFHHVLYTTTFSRSRERWGLQNITKCKESMCIFAKIIDEFAGPGPGWVLIDASDLFEEISFIWAGVIQITVTAILPPTSAINIKKQFAIMLHALHVVCILSARGWWPNIQLKHHVKTKNDTNWWAQTRKLESQSPFLRINFNWHVIVAIQLTFRHSLINLHYGFLTILNNKSVLCPGLECLSPGPGNYVTSELRLAPAQTKYFIIHDTTNLKF